MDDHFFRSLLQSSGVDVWTLIDAAIGVCSSDHPDELKTHRDGIVEKLYTPPVNSNPSRCQNCDDASHRSFTGNGHVPGFVSDEKKPSHVLANGAVLTQSAAPDDNDDDDDDDENEQDRRDDSVFGDELDRILSIKEELKDPQQSEESVVDLLQTLADMDLTYKALKETDIGRHVNRLRKHSSGDVSALVKKLIRKWKDSVDEWAGVNMSAGGHASSAALIGDGDSPQQKVTLNGHHQMPDDAYSPNLNSEDSIIDRRYGPGRYHTEPESKPKQVNGRFDTPTRAVQARAPASATSNRPRVKQEKMNDDERFASAGKRLQDNYKEIEKAKKQRTIQVMDIHEIPKKKNTFFAKNRGASHGKQW